MRGSHLVLILPLAVLAGCSLVRVGPAAEIMDLEQRTDAEKNLDAVRAMQRELHRPSAEADLPGGTGSSSVAEPMDDQPLASGPPSPAVPPSAPMKEQPIVQWTPPVVARPVPPDRPVPAYTIPAPSGPGEAGAVRCVPDGLGGQRCLRP